MQANIVRCLNVLPRNGTIVGLKLKPINQRQLKYLDGFSRPFVTSRNKQFERKNPTPTDKHSDKKTGNEIDVSRENPYANLTFGEKVKEAGKTASYSVVIVAGLGMTGFVIYLVGRELLSSQSPVGVYSDALSECKNCTELTDAIGEPMKGYGELTRRGRRRHVSHVEFQDGKKKRMRMQFYVEGPHRKGTAHVEVQKDEGGKYEYKYLIVELHGYPLRTIVIHDNR